MQKRRGAGQPVGAAVADALMLPQSSVWASARVECNGNREAVVEGCTGILECSGSRIRMMAGGLILRFLGRELTLLSLCYGNAVVKGEIEEIAFLSRRASDVPG